MRSLRGRAIDDLHQGAIRRRQVDEDPDSRYAAFHDSDRRLQHDSRHEAVRQRRGIGRGSAIRAIDPHRQCPVERCPLAGGAREPGELGGVCQDPHQAHGPVAVAAVPALLLAVPIEGTHPGGASQGARRGRCRFGVPAPVTPAADRQNGCAGGDRAPARVGGGRARDAARDASAGAVPGPGDVRAPGHVPCSHDAHFSGNRIGRGSKPARSGRRARSP